MADSEEVEKVLEAISAAGFEPETAESEVDGEKSAESEENSPEAAMKEARAIAKGEIPAKRYSSAKEYVRAENEGVNSSRG